MPKGPTELSLQQGPELRKDVAVYPIPGIGPTIDSYPNHGQATGSNFQVTSAQYLGLIQ